MKIRAWIVGLVCIVGSTALGHAQTGIISTYVGPPAPVEGAMATASAIEATRVAADGAGGFYVVSENQAKVYYVSRSGVIRTVAGSNKAGFGGDGGPAISAQLNRPTGVALDGFGNLYIAEWDNNRVRKVTPGGIISTVASGLSCPNDVAVDSAGNLYVADWCSNRIRKVSAIGGLISTVAGNGIQGFSGDGGPATSAELSFPTAIAVDGVGNLYIATPFGRRIRRVTPAGVINTVAGNGTGGFGGDGGPATSAQLDWPGDVTVDGAGTLYISDYGNGRIRRVTSAGVISTVVFVATDYFDLDGLGNLYVAKGHLIKKVTPEGTITTVAGIGPGFSGDGGPATSAQLSGRSGMALDSVGNLYIADVDNHRIRKATPAGVISTVAGNGSSGFSGDGGPATSAQLASPYAVALDSADNLYIADSSNFRIRKVTPAGVISTVAGDGIRGFSGDGGPATFAQFGYPFAIAVDRVGNLYVADASNHRIRKVTPAGIITTVAGNGIPGSSGDGGPATSAQINLGTLISSGLAVDGSGNLYIADLYDPRVRMVTPAGVISTVAGNGSIGFNGDGGPAISASVAPFGVSVDGAGNLYITEERRIRKVTPEGLISTVAGNGLRGFGGDGGPATSAQLYSFSLIVDGAGNIYSSEYPYRIRKITMGLSTVSGFSTSLRGDFNGDGKSDILWQHSDGSMALWLMNGTVPGGAGGLLGSYSGWQVRKLGDFNGDGRSDILWHHADGSTVMWLMNGFNVLGTTGSLVDRTSGWVVKDVGDFNGDGRGDIVWQHLDGSSAVWLMNGLNAISGAYLIGPGSGWSVKTLGDLNGDGKSDIVWQHTDGSSAVWLMNGLNAISGAYLIGPGSGWSVKTLGDLNGDGKSDIVWQYTDGNSAIWLMNGTSPSATSGLNSGSEWSPIP